MKNIIALLTLLVTVDMAQAQSFKVIKIQGKKAIVEVNDPTLVTLNQTYNVDGSNAPASSATSFSSSGGRREHGIAMSFSFLSQSSPSVSSMTLSGTYLWNFKKWEAGPTLALANVSGGGVTTNSTTIGGVGFWNFTENRPGADKILSLTGSLTLASGSGSSRTNLSFGPNYRWFMLSQDHCFSISALYKMAQSSGSNTSGFLLEAAIATYF